MQKFKNYIVVAVFFLVIIFVDAYSYWGLKAFEFYGNTIFKTLFWLIPSFFILGFSGIFIFKPKNISPEGFKKVMLFFASFLLFYLPKFFFIAFLLLSDFLWLVIDVTFSNNSLWLSLNTFLVLSGITISVFIFSAVFVGIVWGRFNFKIRRVPLEFKNLPASFNNFKVVQISDLHIGSFIGNMKHVQRGINLVNNENPDIILFTGDLITVHADEVIKFFPILKQLKAKYGMYSVTGNHSYSGKDYFHWNKVDSPEENLAKIINHHKEIGFDILMNEHRKICINGDYITLLGIENWGYPPFPQEGDIEKAFENVADDSFKLLLSHDPSFFDAKVKDNYNIDLTLSGHTHAMQMGIKIGNFEWSPSKFKYPKWGGLYMENGKFLYVNRGFGHVIYSARIGMPPEITVFNLTKINN
jgi:predicted MPP superfamily phosphohydrolase